MAKEMVVPSRILDKPWVFSKRPLQTEDSDNPDEDVGGKWMLFFKKDLASADAEGLTPLDRAWYKVDELCETGKLYLAKTATGYDNSLAINSRRGLICGYCRDYRDVVDIRRSARNIREALAEELGNQIIYFKTNSATHAGTYRKFGAKRVSIYRYMADHTLWESAEDGVAWNQLSDF